jgi:hypothetical protein
MHDTETKEKFIVLRAKGRGLCRIAEELGVSSGTTHTWDTQFQDEIAKLRALEIEAIRERVLPDYEQELTYLADEVKRVQAELRSRDYGYVDTPQLHWYQGALFARIDKKCPPLTPPPAKDAPASPNTE